MNREHEVSGGYVSVVGGSNIDIVAKSGEVYFPGTSNPGTVTRTPGGVGRNLAHILALLGVEVEFYSIVGDDEAGLAVVDSVRRLGVRTDSVWVSERRKTGEYVAVQDADGSLASAVSDMEVMELLLPDKLEPHKQRLSESAMIVADTNLPAATLRWLSELAAASSTPLLVEPVSREKTSKLKDLPHPAAWISPSETEFSEIFRIAKRGFESLLIAIDETPNSHFRLTGSSGLRGCPSDNILVTLGRRGVVLMHRHCEGTGPEDEEDGEAHEGEAGGERGNEDEGPGLWCGKWYRPYRVEVINDNGAGDAFFAGFIAALWHGKSDEEAVYFGMATAARVLRCPATVDEDLDFSTVEEYVRSNDRRD